MFLGYYSTLLINLENNSHNFWEERSWYLYHYIAVEGKFRIIGYFLLEYVEQKNMLQDVL